MRIILAVSILVVTLYGVPAHAAHVWLDAPQEEVNRLDTFYIPIRIDLEDECINVVQVTVTYNPEQLTIRDVGIGKSILTLWTKSPEIVRVDGKETGTVTFEGGIPGGYCGRVVGDPGLTNILAELVVSGTPLNLDNKESDIAYVTLDPSTDIYAHDGLGTKLNRTLQGATILLTKSDQPPYDAWVTDVSADTQAPEYFDITLVPGPSAGNEYSYIVFSTTDKQSGVDHYEVRETDPNQFGFLSWIGRPSYWTEAQSPYVLRDQRLHSTIFVKAVDEHGNERIVEYTPPMSPLVRYTSPVILMLVVVLIILLGGIVVLATAVRRNKGKSRSKHDQAEETNI